MSKHVCFELKWNVKIGEFEIGLKTQCDDAMLTQRRHYNMRHARLQSKAIAWKHNFRAAGMRSEARIAKEPRACMDMIAYLSDSLRRHAAEQFTCSRMVHSSHHCV